MQYGAHNIVHRVYKSLSSIRRINRWFGFPEVHFSDGSSQSMGSLHESKRRATGVSELRWGQGSREWLV